MKKKQVLRDKLIHILDKNNSELERQEINDLLYSTNLTMYSKSFDSIIYNELSRSIIDRKISLHPEQIKILNLINEKDALIISAPTSFGKTFCVFEYIAINSPKIVFLIAPTNALIAEYRKKILNKFEGFNEYKVLTHFDEVINLEKDKIIFLTTQERVVEFISTYTINEIDLLVIDEAYKLKQDEEDRTLILNYIFLELAKISKKYILLAPFINEITNINILKNNPYFYRSSFSPVVNEVKIIKTSETTNKNKIKEEKFLICDEIIKNTKSDENNLIYIPTPKDITRFLDRNELSNQNNTNILIDEFIKWSSKEFNEEWMVIKAIKKGFVVNYGKIPIGIREFLMDIYEKSIIKNMICTSTLIEGVNTATKNLIILSPSRKSFNHDKTFNEFDFHNLVGRTGRLNKFFVGYAYYVKSSLDPEFKKSSDFKEKIEFEITNDKSLDVKILKNEIENEDSYKNFLFETNISHDEYKKKIGNKFRFVAIQKIWENLKEYHVELINEINKNIENNEEWKNYKNIKIIFKILGINNQPQKIFIFQNLIKNFDSSVNEILKSIKNIDYFKKIKTNNIIDDIIDYKYNFIEFNLLPKINIIKILIEEQKWNKVLFEYVSKLINSIERWFYHNSKSKRMLIELGISRNDIYIISKIIGEDFDDIREIISKIIEKNEEIKEKCSFITKYVVDKLIKKQ